MLLYFGALNPLATTLIVCQCIHLKLLYNTRELICHITGLLECPYKNSRMNLYQKLFSHYIWQKAHILLLIKIDGFACKRRNISVTGLLEFGDITLLCIDRNSFKVSIYLIQSGTSSIIQDCSTQKLKFMLLRSMDNHPMFAFPTYSNLLLCKSVFISK